MNQRIQLASLDDQRNAEAREAVRQRISWPANLTPANVTYHSRGHAMVIGSASDAEQAGRALQNSGLASITLLMANADDPATQSPEASPQTETPLDTSPQGHAQPLVRHVMTPARSLRYVFQVTWVHLMFSSMTMLRLRSIWPGRLSIVTTSTWCWI